MSLYILEVCGYLLVTVFIYMHTHEQCFVCSTRAVTVAGCFNGAIWLGMSKFVHHALSLSLYRRVKHVFICILQGLPRLICPLEALADIYIYMESQMPDSFWSLWEKTEMLL